MQKLRSPTTQLCLQYYSVPEPKPVVTTKFLAPYPPCANHNQCQKYKQFCGTQCWTGGCGDKGKALIGVKREFCQPCNLCKNSDDSVNGDCGICPVIKPKPPAYPSCADHSQCKHKQFCSTACWTGGCGSKGTVPAGSSKRNFCQPCTECQKKSNSVTRDCSMCNVQGNVTAHFLVHCAINFWIDLCNVTYCLILAVLWVNWSLD